MAWHGIQERIHAGHVGDWINVGRMDPISACLINMTNQSTLFHWQANVLDVWRKHFVLEENMLEVRVFDFNL